MMLEERADQIVEALVEAASQSSIHPEMVTEIKSLKANGYRTQDVFGISMWEFISNQFDKLPLAIRIKWFDSLA